MREIVTGIDFSRSSMHAFEYAVKLAAVADCDIKLVYVKKKRDIHTILPEGSKGEPISIEKAFKKLCEKHQDSLKGKITYRVLHGKIWEEISNQAKYTDAQLIVAGAHGMSGYEEQWIGNNAVKIIAHSLKPVLIVKKNYKPSPKAVEKIVVPLDSTFETIQKIPYTIELARIFKAQINILSLYSSKIKNIEERVELNTREALSLVADSGLRYINEKLTCDNIAQATVDYAIKRNADLISIMSEQEFSSQNLHMGTYAQQTINLSPLPVLTHRTRVLMNSDTLLA